MIEGVVVRKEDEGGDVEGRSSGTGITYSPPKPLRGVRLYHSPCNGSFLGQRTF